MALKRAMEATLVHLKAELAEKTHAHEAELAKVRRTSAASKGLYKGLSRVYEGLSRVYKGLSCVYMYT